MKSFNEYNKDRYDDGDIKHKRLKEDKSTRHNQKQRLKDYVDNDLDDFDLEEV